MSDLKYKYAYDQNNNIVHINNAFKNQYGQSYYLMPNKECELTLADGVKNQKHFRIKQGATIGGVTITGGSMGESVAHHNAKMQIVKDGFFDWSVYRIYIQKPKYEYRLEGSRYRADLFAELLCGTPCAIEIIISFGVSESKRTFIENQQILTFELYYDKTGVQDLKGFDCYGNEQVTDIKRRILEGKSRVENVRRGIEREKWQIRTKYSLDEKRLRAEEDSIKREDFEEGRSFGLDFSKVNELEESVKSNISRIRETKREIEKCAEIYRKLKSEEDKVNGLEISVKRLEDAFREIAANCKAEWFGNPPKGMSEYQFIKYMCE
jgi:hypothetical protein